MAQNKLVGRGRDEILLLPPIALPRFDRSHYGGPAAHLEWERIMGMDSRTGPLTTLILTTTCAINF